MVTVSRTAEINRNNVVVLAKSRGDEIPPVGMCCMAMHEHQARFSRVRPVQVVNGSAINQAGSINRDLTDKLLEPGGLHSSRVTRKNGSIPSVPFPTRSASI